MFLVSKFSFNINLHVQIHLYRLEISGKRFQFLHLPVNSAVFTDCGGCCSGGGLTWDEN